MDKNQEMKMLLCSETIVTSEDINTYVWVMNMLAEIEPRWSVFNIRLIFADNFTNTTSVN